MQVIMDNNTPAAQPHRSHDELNGDSRTDAFNAPLRQAELALARAALRHRTIVVLALIAGVVAIVLAFRHDHLGLHVLASGIGGFFGGKHLARH
jgi:hypothetical protein